MSQSPSPQSLQDVIQHAQEAPGVAARLQKRFGLGSNPELRRELYARLEAECEGPQGRRVLEVIDSVVRNATGKDDPGRYFAYCVVRRLQEKGLMEGGTHADW